MHFKQTFLLHFVIKPCSVRPCLFYGDSSYLLKCNKINQNKLLLFCIYKLFLIYHKKLLLKSDLCNMMKALKLSKNVLINRFGSTELFWLATSVDIFALATLTSDKLWKRLKTLKTFDVNFFLILAIKNSAKVH